MSYSRTSSRPAKKENNTNSSPQIVKPPESKKPVELFQCGKCKQKRSLEKNQWCPTCKPQHHHLQTGQALGRTAPNWLPNPVTENAAATLNFAKNPYLKDHDSFAEHIQKHARRYSDSTSSGGFGDQSTL
ncbi:MAG TPA: hypothetical protein VGM87_14770, partial [Roseomonas sp.]